MSTSLYSLRPHAVILTMLKQESGHVVNLSSVVGRFLQANSTHYNAAKAG